MKVPTQIDIVSAEGVSTNFVLMGLLAATPLTLPICLLILPPYREDCRQRYRNWFI